MLRILLLTCYIKKVKKVITYKLELILILRDSISLYLNQMLTLLENTLQKQPELD